MPTSRINADKPHLWKADVLASVDQFNQWFMEFAPAAFRSTRVKTTEHVKTALLATNDLRNLNPEMLQISPGVLPTLRMCTAPPLAVDRLVGLAGANKSLIGRMEEGKLAARMRPELLAENLQSVCRVVSCLLDHDIFPWLNAGKTPTAGERYRAATIVADRLCTRAANTIVRNAREQRQLALIRDYLKKRGYQEQPHPAGKPLSEMKRGSYCLRLNLIVEQTVTGYIPVDIAVQRKRPRGGCLPILIEAKSAGDFINANKRRDEEAVKIQQLKETFGDDVNFILFLCGYFGTDYLGYEAAEGIDWVWEHRIDDFAKLGI